MKKRIKCPSCGVILEVPLREEDSSIALKCPNCSHRFKVSFQQEKPKDRGETVYGGAAGAAPRHTEDDGHTVFAASKKATKGVFRFQGQAYPLELGMNIIGRKAPNSEAQIQVPTDDRHMSRQHANVNMTRIADGSLKTIISCCKDRLTTIVGGQSLKMGDQVILVNGTNVTLGNTTIEYIEE